MNVGAMKGQKATAAEEWRNRMRNARSNLPKGIGQQKVIDAVIVIAPHLDSLSNSTRWREAWLCRVADPEITLLVEEVAVSLKDKEKTMRKRLSRHKLNR
ncbi:hypothetical protein ACS5NO_20635 [Larkinella sp. GY13]|uniref:hypothetical protein n=1 Tax=Larkinella sp. GY13 TaxID=3453720 RepID=UPI003EF042A0